MHDRGKMNVVKNPSSFRNSCSLKEGKVAILRLLQVTKTLIATGPMIQSAMTEWATSPWGFGYWGLLNNQWDKFYATWLWGTHTSTAPITPTATSTRPCHLFPAGTLLLVQNSQAESPVKFIPCHCSPWSMLVATWQGPWVSPGIHLQLGLCEIFGLPWSFFQLSSSPSSLQTPFLFQTCASFQKHFLTSYLLSSTPSPELSWSK